MRLDEKVVGCKAAHPTACYGLLVSHPRLWPQISYHRAVARGKIAADEMPPLEPEGEFGERPAADLDSPMP